jgi:hypothetical protein
MTPTAHRLAGGISAYLAPRLALDQRMPPIAPLVKDVTRNNLAQMRNRIAARVRNVMRGRLAYDVADLSDLEDLLCALEELSEGEQLEPERGEDRYGRRRARDNEPNDPFSEGGGGGYGRAGAHHGVDPNILSRAPADALEPELWDDPENNNDNYWKEEDEEERRRNGIANSTGSEAIDARIRANADRQRRAADKRRQTLDRMRAVIQDAIKTAKDTEVEGHNVNVSQSSALEPGYERIDNRSTGQDRRRVAGDSASTPRQRMLQNMSRIGFDAIACTPAVVGVSSPNTGGAASPSFAARFPNAAKIKI